MKNFIKSLFTIKKPDVVYDETFFQSQWFEGWKELKEVLKQLIQLELHWKRILDFGCGPGVMVDLMNDQGWQYFGCDYSREAKELYQEYYGKYPECYLKSIPDEKDFDLMVSFDVFEHMTDKQIDLVLKKTWGILWFVFNISREKSIPGHINIKSDAQWIEFFDSRNLEYNEEMTSKLRKKYSELRPGNLDQWNRNLFVLKANLEG